MNSISRTRGDKIFDIVNILFFAIVLIVTVYPLYFMLIASFSSPTAVNNGEIWLWPKDITFKGYEMIFDHSKIWTGYKNSIIYTVVGTTINVVLTITGGYALSRKDLPGRNIFMFFIVFTMFFSGGLIPSYLLVKDLGMVNTMWALIVPGAISAYNLIIVRTFFQSTIPDELLEAGIMDGCTNLKFFTNVVVPLSKPIIAVMVLFHAVGHWNAYFSALIYLRDTALYPLQLVLREVLILTQANEVVENSGAIVESSKEMANVSGLIKYGIVIIASLPMLILYPFIQKHFVKGVMIGSIKG
ncbi:carbohydrate ABC transporter permease [Lederbergia wuyishanensis]|uniref:Aldouronate transport system permease protein n=1 Tax=Lederbergia wuyishanensis TaxID=1347903 RepID=A0ABU0D7F6_9BACI|nr:carbohydrate ABC transporter permease [Lederbergia wuyishanensis]MCJ8009022.1 carbohydrate ABC transporter permease [Lederbergia wuyishanensis]MDQ0344354.1 putative aldouronate transport system permease protein [Lederbergia wuyishanensis]